MVEKITSATNARVKRLAALCKKARLRKEEQVFLLEGERLYTDTPPAFMKEVYMTEEFLHDKLGGKAPENCTILTPEIMRKVSDTETPQGVLCVARMPQYRMEDLLGALPVPTTVSAKSDVPYVTPEGKEYREAPLLLILENIQDPGNLGTMMRTAEAAGATGVLMSRDTVDLFNPKTVRATMSAIFRVPFLYTDDLTGEMRALRDDYGVRIFAAHLKASRPYDEINYSGPCAFLIGNEGNGLTDAAADTADARIHIPMKGQIESLNAAMAAGILMFEASRQRRTPDHSA